MRGAITQRHKGHLRTGFGLIEIVIASAILGSTIVAVWGIFIYANARVAIARARTVAINLANEQMEGLRNMPFDDLGTTTGQPNGAIPSTQVISRNGIDFTVDTTIRYYDSESDGTISGLLTGKHVEYWPTACTFDPDETTSITLEFYANGVTHVIDFQEYYHGNNFNWSGKVTVAGEDQHFHITTNDANTACPKLSLQTQNVEKPFRLLVDDVLWVTYTAADTFTPATGYSHAIIGQGGETLVDPYPNDYKQVEVQVCWNVYTCPVPVRLTTFMAQFGLETASDTGVMLIEVLDASGNPVANADILVENDTLSMTAIAETSDENGKRMIPVLDPSVESYKVTVTKAGYSTDQTYDAIAPNNNPSPENLTINVGELTESTFVIDLLSDFVIDVIKLDDTPAGGVTLTIEGSKEISAQGPSIKKFPLTEYTLDGSGHLVVADLEFDTYTLTVELPSGDVVEVVPLAPNTSQSVFISPHRLTVEVDRTGSGQTALADAIIQLTRGDISYDKTINTDENGEASFTSLHTGDFDYVISLEGYESATGTVTIGQGQNDLAIELISSP